MIEWNELDLNIRNSESLTNFKINIMKFIRPSQKRFAFAGFFHLFLVYDFSKKSEKDILQTIEEVMQFTFLFL